MALCLLAAGAATITGVCGLVARGYLMGQADQQLRAYAGRLVSHPFAASPIYGLAPGTPSAIDPGGGALGIEVRGSAGQLVLRAGTRARPGPVIPAVSAGIAAGQLATVAAGGGDSWRVIAEPVHYRARRIPFSYSADGFSVFITARARPGLAGTLVVGLDLANIDQAVGRLAVTGLAASVVVALVAACSGVVVIRAILRPLTHAQQTLAAAAAGELSRRVPEGHGGDTGRLARSVNTMLNQIEHRISTHTRSEAAARRSTARMCRIIAGTGHQLRRPLSVIGGLAGAYRRGGRSRAGELDRMIGRVADEATRMDALIDDLLPTWDNWPPPQP